MDSEDNFGDTEIKDSFRERITTLLNEGLKLQENEKINKLWTPEDDEEIDKLREYVTLINMGNEYVAIDEFEKNSKLRSFDHFVDYISSKPKHNIEILRYINKSGGKTKANRATSKITICKSCGRPTKIVNDKMVCINPYCHDSNAISNDIILTKTDSMKHTRNKIEMLIENKDPPGKITALLPLITIWLTDLDYLYDWLKYQETFQFMRNKITEQMWVRKFRNVYVQREGVKFTERKIKNEEKYAWSYPEYKLLITQFHSMLTECNRLGQSQCIVSNMTSLDDDKKLEIIRAFKNEKDRVPVVNEIYYYEEVGYGIGNYFNQLALMNDESDLKLQIDEIFGTKIRIPGLMTNFLALPTKNIERFILTENYAYIIHKVFQLSSIHIPRNDINKMVELIKKFDEFVQAKTIKGDKKMIRTNSKSYSCKLKCILVLPYFYKYSKLWKFMPTKSDETTSKIEGLWDEFEAGDGYELVRQYYETTEVEPEDQKSRKIFQMDDQI